MNPVAWFGGERATTLANLRFEFSPPIGIAMGILILALVAGWVGWRYFLQLQNRRGESIWGLLIWRVLAWTLLVFLLLNPALVGEKFDPGQNFVLLLFDDSRSMRIPMKPGESRGEHLRQAYRAASAEFEAVLGQRYSLARYAFGERTQRIERIGELTFSQRETRMEEAVANALEDFEGISVAGVIVFSDGISQPVAASTESRHYGGVPVMTVGIGDVGDWRDLALGDLRVSRSFGDGRPVRIQVNLSAAGLSGRSGVVELLQEDRLLTQQEVRFTQNQEVQNIRLEAVPDEKGWLVFKVRARLKSQSSDTVGVSKSNEDWVLENNQMRFLVDNRDRKYRLFYFSGRPNWENKFIQRALTSDPQFDLISVLRISAAERKFVYRGKRSSMVNPLFEGFDALQDQPRYDEAVFLRFGGDAELAGRGYPEDSEEMFTYDLMVLGDIEAGFFSQSQLALTRDFVRKRGGNLLMLGGPYSFSEGGWRGTVLESIWPVMLEQPAGPEQRIDDLTRKFRMRPTLEGNLSGVLSLNGDSRKDEALWGELPELSGLHGFSISRVGATVYARSEGDGPGTQDLPIFASQRYGLGKTAIMATVATWPWEMKTKPDDLRHGRIWRQMVRHLVADTPKPLQVLFDEQSAVEGNPLPLRMVVRDDHFEPKTGARVSLELLDPKGETHALAVEESLEEAGRYTAAWTPREPGLHRLTMTALDAQGKALGEVEEAFWAPVDDREYRQAASQPEALRQLAQANQGEYFNLADLAKIPDRMPWTQNHIADTVRLPFWHFPGFFLVLALVWCLEWYLRRKRGHA